MNESKLRSQLHSLIPGGAHTYSRGDDQFPENAPVAIIQGKGCEVKGSNGKTYFDLGMGLRSVSIGHGNKQQNKFIYSKTLNGTNFTRPNLEELFLAEKLHEVIPCAEMVKFAKNGSDVTTGAVKLARAYTGKRHVLRCANNPFFSVDDWFIGDTPMDRGVPSEISTLTRQFAYGDIEILVKLRAEIGDDIACVILEPFGVAEFDIEYLKALRTFCTLHRIVLIFDEVISGFRYHLKGAQFLAGVTPDLATFGKALGNGFPISALCGKKEIMEIGGIDHIQDRVFLLSTTFGSERSGLAAGLWTLSQMEKDPLFQGNYEVGSFVKTYFNKVAFAHGINNLVQIVGSAINPIIQCTNEAGEFSGSVRYKLMKHLFDQGLMMPYISISTSHRDKFVKEYRIRIEKALFHFANDKQIEFPELKPVFRKKN